MLKYFNSRSVRLLLSVAITVSLASVAATRVLYQTSIEAVVNAPRIEVEAPIDGTVGEITVLPGRTVKHGAVLMNMRHDVFSRGTVDEQSSRILVLREKVNALESQIESLRAIRDSLRGRVKEYRNATVEQLRAIAQSAEAKATERAQNLDRVVALRAADGSTPADVERARAEATIARFDAASARAQAEAAQRGVITAQGAQDVPYSQQRVDEIALQITNLLAEFTLATNELRDIESTTNAPTTDSISDGTVPIRANVDGVVWAVSPSNGSHIRKGTSLVTLIDCSRLYLDATISPRYQDKIEPGANVRLRFAGTSHEFPGKVDYVRGGGVREDGLAAAQLTLDNRRNDSHAIIHVDEKEIGALPGNFCQVGRSAKVIFDGPDFHESMQQTASVTEGMTAWVRSLLKR